MKSIRVVTIFDKCISYLLCFCFCSAENDSENFGIVIRDTLQSEITIFRMNNVIQVLDVLVTRIALTHGDFERFAHIVLGNTLHLVRHGCRE